MTELGPAVAGKIKQHGKGRCRRTRKGRRGAGVGESNERWSRVSVGLAHGPNRGAKEANRATYDRASIKLDAFIFRHSKHEGVSLCFAIYLLLA